MQLNLLNRLPKTKRNITQRAEKKDPEVIRLSKLYGELYFDGPREYGYGGYRYDGRWMPVAQDIVSHYNLKTGDRILDVGCAKGFLVKDLIGLGLGLEPFGIDISDYAVKNCEKEVIGRIHRGPAHCMPFPDGAFDLVLAINVLHNYKKEDVKKALLEIIRVGKDKFFVQVDSYHTEEEKKTFESWVLTAEYHDYPDGWKTLFDEVGYVGDYNWTLV